MKNCQNCRFYYLEFGKKGNVVGDGCKVEDDIPFFDRELYIGFAETHYCDKWEDADEKAEE